MSSSFSPTYGKAASPFWGPQTSAVNFCEEDYIVTRYVAELVNTVTSLAYVGYGLLGIYRQKPQGFSPFSVVNLPYWGLTGIGICSGLYHTTMKYHTQMADETSMHLAMGCVLIRIFTFQRPPPVQQRNAIAIAVGLTSFVIYHWVMDEFVLHVILFFALSLTVGWQSYSLIQKSSRPDSDKGMLTSLVTFATCNALFAYFLWNIDVNLCSTLTDWKHQLGKFWSVPLELHGWWHVMTAVSCYTFVALIEFLTSPEDEKGNAKTAIGFVWPVKQVLQTVAQRRSTK